MKGPAGLKGERGDLGSPGAKGQKGEPPQGDKGDGGPPGARVRLALLCVASIRGTNLLYEYVLVCALALCRALPARRALPDLKALAYALCTPIELNSLRPPAERPTLCSIYAPTFLSQGAPGADGTPGTC